MPRLHLLLLAAVVTLLAWGALSFGAVYPWAFVPLAIGSAVVGIAALRLVVPGLPQAHSLSVAAAIIAAGALLQTVPLPPSVLATVSPGTVHFLENYDLQYRFGSQTPDAGPDSASRPARPISLDSALTLRGLGLFAGFVLLMLGSARLVSAVGAERFVIALSGLGVVLALIGIGQYAITLGDVHPKIYGFWAPAAENARPFGPYVNPNHFAGWMLMAIPLSLGYLQDALVRVLDWGRVRRADRLSVVNSPEFARLGSMSACVVVMGVSLLMTGSRSAIASFTLGSVLALAIAMRRIGSRSARMALVAAVAVISIAMWSWTGIDVAARKVVDTGSGSASLGGRIAAWRDTVRIIRDFPLTGTGLDTYSRAGIVYSSSRTLHFNEAHNEYLQIAAEGGLLLGVPIAALLLLAVREIWRRFAEAPKAGTTYWLRVGAVVGLVSIALQSTLEFSLQMPGNAALFAVVTGIALHQSPSMRGGHRQRRQTREPADYA